MRPEYGEDAVDGVDEVTEYRGVVPGVGVLVVDGVVVTADALTRDGAGTGVNRGVGVGVGATAVQLGRGVVAGGVGAGRSATGGMGVPGGGVRSLPQWKMRRPPTGLAPARGSTRVRMSPDFSDCTW